MSTEELTAEDLIFLPVGSVVEFLEPNGKPRYYETTKRKDRLWDCTFCPANHTSRDIASFRLKMRLKKMGDPEVGETITAEQVGVANHFPVGTRLQDADGTKGMCWNRVEGGWLYEYEDVFENPYGTPTKSLNEDYAPYTVIPKDETKEAELPRLNKKGDAPEKREFTAAEASRMRGVIFQDDDGDFWKNFDGDWKFISAEYPRYLHLWEIPSSTLSPDNEPYTFFGYKDDDLAGENEIPRFAKEQFNTSELSKNTATPAMEYHFSTDAGPAISEEDIEVEKTEGLTVENLLEGPDRIYFDSEGDLWGCRDGKWAWGRSLGDLDRKLNERTFLYDQPLGGGIEPYRVAEYVSLPKTEPEPDAGPNLSEEVTSLYGNEDIEAEKTPTITESLNKIAKSLERIAKALEEK